MSLDYMFLFYEIRGEIEIIIINQDAI